MAPGGPQVPYPAFPIAREAAVRSVATPCCCLQLRVPLPAAQGAVPDWGYVGEQQAQLSTELCREQVLQYLSEAPKCCGFW